MSEAKLEPLRPLYHLTSNQIFNYVPSPKYASVSQFCVAQVETRLQDNKTIVSHTCVFNYFKYIRFYSSDCIQIIKYIDIILNHTILTIM